jgi:hypothetical protein
LGLKASEAPRLNRENYMRNMRKLILLIVVIGVLLLAGCPQPSSPPGDETPPPPPEEQPDNTWISPPSVTVDNLYPGAKDVEWPLTIHNGKDELAKFSVTFRVPSSAAEGYVTAPSEAQDWVIIANPSPVLAAKESKQILISVEMPEGATAPAKWEFWVVVKDVTQTGMVQTELACRCLVTMSE